MGEVVVRTGLRLQRGSILDESLELLIGERPAGPHVDQVACERDAEVVIVDARRDLGEDLPNPLVRNRATASELLEQGHDEQVAVHLTARASEFDETRPVQPLKPVFDRIPQSADDTVDPVGCGRIRPSTPQPAEDQKQFDSGLSPPARPDGPRPGRTAPDAGSATGEEMQGRRCADPRIPPPRSRPTSWARQSPWPFGRSLSAHFTCSGFACDIGVVHGPDISDNMKTDVLTANVRFLPSSSVDR